MALGKRNPDPPSKLEIERNKPAELRHKKSKAPPKAFFRKRDPSYTYAFGGKWKTKHPDPLEKE